MRPFNWPRAYSLSSERRFSHCCSTAFATILRNWVANWRNRKSVKRLAVEGGWYAVLRVPVTQSDEDLAIEILQKASVLVHPGHFYDFPSDGYLIVSLLTPAATFREGTERMLRLLNS